MKVFKCGIEAGAYEGDYSDERAHKQPHSTVCRMTMLPQLICILGTLQISTNRRATQARTGEFFYVFFKNTFFIHAHERHGKAKEEQAKAILSRKRVNGRERVVADLTVN